MWQAMIVLQKLLYLWYRGPKVIISGYGITLEHENPGSLVGLLAFDGPNPADEVWLRNIEETFGECQLVLMTRSGLRSLACQMEVDPSSVQYLGSDPSMGSAAIQASLWPFQVKPPAPTLRLSWDEERQFWANEFETVEELPVEIRRVFERTGYGCLASCWNSIRVRLKAHFRSRTWITPGKRKAHLTRRAS